MYFCLLFIIKSSGFDNREANPKILDIFRIATLRNVDFLLFSWYATQYEYITVNVRIYITEQEEFVVDVDTTYTISTSLPYSCEG